RLDEAERRQQSDRDPEEAERKAILSERAQLLAQARDETGTEQAVLVSFRLLGQRLAVPMEQVEELLDAAGLAPLPGVGAHIAGVVVSRLRVVPVLDLRQLLQFGQGIVDLNVIVVLRSSHGAFGVAVQEIEGLVEVPKEVLTRGAGEALRILPDRRYLLDAERIGALEAQSSTGESA
ncbi:MAG: chemotaxis protein CheW, partial [Myxococcaceae bacterium]